MVAEQHCLTYFTLIDSPSHVIGLFYLLRSYVLFILYNTDISHFLADQTIESEKLSCTKLWTSFHRSTKKKVIPRTASPSPPLNPVQNQNTDTRIETVSFDLSSSSDELQTSASSYIKTRILEWIVDVGTVTLMLLQAT